MLLEPLTFRNGVRARNRVWLAPMTNGQSQDDGSLGDDELAWLELRARGGFSVIESCASHVSKDGQGWQGELGVYDDHVLPGLERLSRMIASHGALGFVQLFHGGQRAPSALTGQTPFSAVAGDVKNAETARAATPEELARVVSDFRDAAVRAHRAGFDGVELHGAHGYLLCQFLSALNSRQDGWGGTLEGRARLVRETMRAVRGAVPASFVVGVRLSPEDFGNARRMDLDESIQTAKWLCDDGADFIHLSLWNSKNNTTKRPQEHAVSIFRAVLPREIVLVVAGGVWTRVEAEELIDRGASAVALGRAAIAAPDWPTRAVDASWDPPRPPFTVAQLEARGLTAKFAGYMRNWKGFVAD